MTQSLPYDTLIPALKDAFEQDIEVPMRHHHDFAHPTAQQDSTLLLMPAWRVGQYLGVKVVTVAPENAQAQLPAIHGVYLLFDASTGQPLLQCDARTLTSRRTAAASALAASFLARPNSERLLMVGTGALAPQLIAAHATARPIK
ncbi:MAG: ornithine cyclodeaminase family protein, partial [Bacteroidota bacterium]